MSGDTEFWARGRRHLLKYGGEFVDFVPVRAEGAFLYDAAGRRVLDFTSGQMSAVLGHSHPEIVATVRDGIGRLDHLFSELKAHAAAENCTPAQLALAWLLSRAPDGCRDVVACIDPGPAIAGPGKGATNRPRAT